MSVLCVVSLTCATASLGVLHSAPLQAETSQGNMVDGMWVGPFLKADWTIDFKNEKGVWSGRYMSSKYNKWHNLENVVVKGRSVSFNIVSTPQLNFSLALDETGKVLSGSAVLPTGSSIPFTAVRQR